MSHGFRRLFVAVAAFGAMLAVQASQADVARAGAIEQEIAAQLVTLTDPVDSGCHGSLFAVVKDFPDAVEYTVTIARTDLPGQDSVIVFNRHERGSLQFTRFPTWSPGAGKIAGLATTESADGAGDDCAFIQADFAARFSIVSARVIRYTATPPAAGRPAVELRTLATPPANDGPAGKDGCTVNLFVTVPRVKGATLYRVRVTNTLVGALGTFETEIDPAALNRKGPAGTKVKPYRSSTRFGHYVLTQQRDGFGCLHAEWKVAEAIKKVTMKIVKG